MGQLLDLARRNDEGIEDLKDGTDQKRKSQGTDHAGFESALVALVAEDSLVRAIGGARMDQSSIEYALYELGA